GLILPPIEDCGISVPLHYSGYRYKITDGNKKILDGEWSELESVYSWYNNPDNPNYCNINYEFDNEEMQTLKTYFFDKNELMQFLGFRSAKYNQDEQQEDKITAHKNKGIFAMTYLFKAVKAKEDAKDRIGKADLLGRVLAQVSIIQGGNE
ncbi:hypothetical protein, partial [Actinobacillus porcinus]|uniref:hypothetical protein n=1 Tax=Actinobacillus porcinus TaxID=51048 RepID=UPI002353839E